MLRITPLALIAVGVMLLGTAGLAWLWHSFYLMPPNPAFTALLVVAIVAGIACVGIGTAKLIGGGPRD